MGLLERIEKNKTENSQSNEKDEGVKSIPLYIDVHKDVKEKVHQEVIQILNKRKLEDESEEVIKGLIDEIVEVEAISVSRNEKTKISKEIYYDVMGYGPIESLLNDPSVTEIMANGPYKVYAEKNGRLELTDITFRDNQHIYNIIDRIVSSVGRHIDESSPMVDARLADGSRVNAVIPPLSLIGPVLTIRKFSKKPITVQKLIEFGSISQQMVLFLQACVKGKLNIIVSGGTGSGKTTLLNVLSSFIPDNERIVTIEDAAELQLMQSHIITLESRPPNLEGKGQITIRDLVRNALRMRPDRIVVGEVRSGETLDMLQAMNTGHDGSLTTAHANTPRDLLSRLETMVLMTGMELPLRAIREQVCSAIDLVVQQARLRDGSRKVIAISEIIGMEGDVITMQDIFVYETDGQLDSSGKFKGRFVSTGIRPKCVEKIRNNGVPVNDEWFR